MLLILFVLLTLINVVLYVYYLYLKYGKESKEELSTPYVTIWWIVFVLWMITFFCFLMMATKAKSEFEFFLYVSAAVIFGTAWLLDRIVASVYGKQSQWSK